MPTESGEDEGFDDGEDVPDPTDPDHEAKVRVVTDAFREEQRQLRITPRRKKVDRIDLAKRVDLPRDRRGGRCGRCGLQISGRLTFTHPRLR